MDDEIWAYPIEQRTQQQIRDLAVKILNLIDNWKNHEIRKAKLSGMSREQIKAQFNKYLSRQRGGNLYIGTVTGFDPVVNQTRDIRVYLGNIVFGGLFDDSYRKDELLEIKKYAKQRGSDNAQRKFRIPKSVMQYILTTPDKQINHYIGKGHIYIDNRDIFGSNPLPNLMEVITHETTHAFQQAKETDDPEAYEAATTEIGKGTGEHHHWETYVLNQTEFEAYLNGLLSYLRSRYNEFEEMAKQQSLTGREAQLFVKQKRKQWLGTLRRKLLDRSVEDLKRYSRFVTYSDEKLSKELKIARSFCSVGDERSCKDAEALNELFYSTFSRVLFLLPYNPKLYAEYRDIITKFIEFYERKLNNS